MGLASFNRMRRSMAEANRLEAERSDRNNEARWAAHHARNKAAGVDEDELDDIKAAEQAGAADFGRKAQEGIDRGDDLPLRKDHAAEIAGRSPHSDPQMPMSQVERLAERVPLEETANERLATFAYADADAAPAELVDEARREVVGLSGVENFDETGEAPAEGEDDPRENVDATELGLGDTLQGGESSTSTAAAGTTETSHEQVAQENLEAATENRDENPVPETTSAEGTTEPNADAAADAAGSGAGAADTAADAGSDTAAADAAGHAADAGASGTADAGSGEAESKADPRDGVDIPDGWRDLPAADRRKIADQLLPEDAPTKNGDEANDAIRAELDRRRDGSQAE